MLLPLVIRFLPCRPEDQKSGLWWVCCQPESCPRFTKHGPEMSATHRFLYTVIKNNNNLKFQPKLHSAHVWCWFVFADVWIISKTLMSLCYLNIWAGIKPKMCYVIYLFIYLYIFFVYMCLWMNTQEFNHSVPCKSWCVCMFTLQTVGFILNVGQQNPSYVKGRQAGRCRERAAGGCAAVAMEEAVAHISLPEHRWWWTRREADRKQRRVPTMKTVLSLHRKWAHAVKTIRILQGLVSGILLLWLWFVQTVVGASGSARKLDRTGPVMDRSVFFCFVFLIKLTGSINVVCKVVLIRVWVKLGIWKSRNMAPTVIKLTFGIKINYGISKR